MTNDGTRVTETQDADAKKMKQDVHQGCTNARVEQLTRSDEKKDPSNTSRRNKKKHALPRSKLSMDSEKLDECQEKPGIQLKFDHQDEEELLSSKLTDEAQSRLVNSDQYVSIIQSTDEVKFVHSRHIPNYGNTTILDVCNHLAPFHITPPNEIEQLDSNLSTIKAEMLKKKDRSTIDQGYSGTGLNSSRNSFGIHETTRRTKSLSNTILTFEEKVNQYFVDKHLRIMSVILPYYGMKVYIHILKRPM